MGQHFDLPDGLIRAGSGALRLAATVHGWRCELRRCPATVPAMPHANNDQLTRDADRGPTSSLSSSRGRPS